MLLLATVNQLKCAFVKATYDYFYCQTYSLDCCLDEAKELYLKAKLALQDACTLDVNTECILNETKVTDYTLDCSDYTAPVPCEDQYPYTVTVSEEPVQLYTHVLNNRTGSNFLNYKIIQNEWYYDGSIFLILSNSPSISIVNGNFTVPAGYTIFDQHEVIKANNLQTVAILVPINWFSYQNSYIKLVRLSQTESDGSDLGNFVVIDVSPTSSPYLSCVGCTTVNPAELYFGHTNWKDAIVTVISNAILTLGGDSDYVLPQASRYGQTATSAAAAAPGHLVLMTAIKHSATEKSYGLKRGTDWITWVNEFTSAESTIYLPANSTWYRSHFLPAGAETLVGPNASIVFNWPFQNLAPTYYNNGNFNSSSFWENSLSQVPFNYSTSGSLVGNKWTIQATVNSLLGYSISLTNADDDLLAATIYQPLTYSTSTPGTYTVTITGTNGCIFTEEIILD